jgi:hypothetical protein
MSNNLIEQNDFVKDESVSYAGRAHLTNLERVPLSKILHTIKTGDGIKENIAKIRKETSQDERDLLKVKTLPVFCYATFKNNRRKKLNLETIHFIVLDFDHLQPQKLIELRATVAADDRVYVAFLSPSGDGLKVMYILDQDVIDPIRYTELYTHYAELISEEYGCPWDRSTKDASRACFMSYDPDIYVNADATTLATEVKVNGQQKQQKKVVQSQVIVNSVTDPLAQLLSTGTTPGNRTHAATQIIGHCMSRGLGKDVAMLMMEMWNQKNIPPHTDAKIRGMVIDMYGRYEKDNGNMPFDIVTRKGCYYKVTYRADKPAESILSSFTVEPTELLELDDSDCLRCNITTTQGYSYKNVLLENMDWHSKQKLLKAIGHQDCTFHGSENDVQALCNYINARVPIRKKGTRVIGLLPAENTWVTEGLNITKDGISVDPKIISYDKGKSAFYHGIKYKNLEEAEYKTLVSGLYADVLHVNEENIIVPWLAWVLVSPVKPIIMSHISGFPLTFVHGEQGSGKTTTAGLMKRLSGYTDSRPHSCKQNWFPLLKLLTATNAIPVYLDEFKATLLDEKFINNIVAFMNKAYSGEIESKGHADQTTKDYVISAPMCVMGEWNISVPSVHERILVVRFKNTVKKDTKMQEALGRILQLPLEGFMPRYIQFCLQQDIVKMFNQAKDAVAKHFGNRTIAPRIVNNLSVMLLGIELFRMYGREYDLEVPPIDVPKLLHHQLKEITGSDSGFVQSAVDQLINELSTMAMKEKEIDPMSGRDPNGFDCKIRKGQDYQTSSTLDKTNGTTINLLAINFTKIFPDFKQYAAQTKYEGDLLDKESYLRLFEECPYVVSKNHPVKFNGKAVRSLAIDIEKAITAGINLEGFGIEQ